MEGLHGKIAGYGTWRSQKSYQNVLSVRGDSQKWIHKFTRAVTFLAKHCVEKHMPGVIVISCTI